MAVQGGLLASSLASQVEKDLQNRSRSKRRKPRLAAPIINFLLAKVVAYSLLGFLLGALGATLQLTPMMRAILQFAIGIFMIGNALRLLKVHPIFRYFNFEPPAFITRFIRKSSKGKPSMASSLFLGAMTVLIPCGITQAMMAIALGSGHPLSGMAIMFAFTLGTSPVFFALSYTAARLGSMIEKYFMRLVTVVLLLMGFFAIDTGLNIAGAPFSLTRSLQELPAFASFSPQSSPNSSISTGLHEPAIIDGMPVVTIAALNNAYVPHTVNAPANQKVKLKLVTDHTTSCILGFTIPELNIARNLPTTGSVLIDLPAQPSGKVLRFSCSMGMYTGKIIYK
jgi:sulfite exporter TauE/SafE